MYLKNYFRLNRAVAISILLAIALALTMRSFQYFPGMDIVTNLWLAIGVLYLSGPYLLSKLRVGFALPSIELYVLFLIVLMPIIASLAAQNVFSQPIYYGIGNQRSVVLCAGALALIHAFRRGTICVAHMEWAFIYLAWGTLFLYTAMTIFVDPGTMSDEGDFIKGGVVEEAHFNFNPVFIIFGFIYYAIVGYLKRDASQYLYALPFLLYILVIDTGRAKLLAMLLAFLVLVVRFGSIKRAVFFGLRAGVAILLLGILLYVFNAEFITSRIGKFSDALFVLLTGETGGDVSANQRIFETIAAIPYIQEHWLIGAGRVSTQWHDGYSGVMGTYFYPGDIGLIGALFMYGLFGCLVYLIQFYFAWRIARNITQDDQHFMFMTAVSGYLLFYGIYSLASGLFVHSLEIGIVMTAILYSASLSIRRGASWKATGYCVALPEALRPKG